MPVEAAVQTLHQGGAAVVVAVVWRVLELQAAPELVQVGSKEAAPEAREGALLWYSIQ
jgi:hypothetical protein